MSEKHIVVHGATVKCQFSVESKTDELEVKTNPENYVNDKEGNEKAVATNKDIGATCKKGTFGKCKLQPNGSGDFLPCQCIILEWIAFYKNVKLRNGGNPLLEDSKATCPIGGPGCISIDNHGQKVSGSKTNGKNANKKVHTQINPLVNIANIGKKKYHANEIMLG